jgi:hypothetical protein
MQLVNPFDSYYRIPREKMRLSAKDVDRLASTGAVASVAGRTIKFEADGNSIEFYSITLASPGAKRAAYKWVNEFNRRVREGRDS